MYYRLSGQKALKRLLILPKSCPPSSKSSLTSPPVSSTLITVGSTLVKSNTLSVIFCSSVAKPRPQFLISCLTSPESRSISEISYCKAKELWYKVGK